ncbi:PhoD-like phosphatase-domain-containing protein [Lentinula raphanica]|uniref:PhoD-like phosphatase-domain-containing protein n=1 Tax=Lentinula raphanica TaxID=153919 RepID=A0AA38PCP9_9AGAR|nr:PhoD-like phosphatase-domain-containing protein [Lentinula raphanica]KAJ3971423.1 PhoD-like phosphatase-domain-containing protein [Lentinula raphanica]
MTLISSIFATAFRLASFLFLRVIPSPILQSAIPALLSLYLLSASLSTKPARSNDNPIAAIFFSLRTPSRVIRWINISINSVLLLAFVDFCASPYFDDASDVIFSRIGAVSDSSAKLLVRYPHLNETIHLVWRESKADAGWNKGVSLNLSQENDWVDTVTLTGLWPSTNYEYALAGANSSLLAYPGSPLQFRTFPDPHMPGGAHFRFLASSCILPNFPYAPLQRRRIKGFDLLAEYLYPTSPATVIGATENFNDNDTLNSSDKDASPSLPPSFLLFLGDFVYADVPLYFGNTKESYRRLYRRNYQSPSFRKIYEKLPMFHAYDDHEIINNYSGTGNDSKQPYPSASDAFHIYNIKGNPSPPSSTKSLDHVPYYYDFRYGDVAFFVMDTRRYRSSPTDPVEGKTMLGEDQLTRMLDWLGKANNTATFKFIVSSVPFTSLWGHDAQYDSWAGFVDEKQTLLNAMHSVPNVFVITGDRHEFATIEFASPTEYGFTVTEFSTSPLSMFYIPLYHTLKMQSDEKFTRTHTKLTKEVPAADAASPTPEETPVPSPEEEEANTQPDEVPTSSDIDPPVSSEVTAEPEIEVVNEEVPRERVIKYIPEGNYKWSSIEIDTRDPERPTLKLEAVIDGKPGYQYEVAGNPVKLQGSTALGAFVSTNVKDLLKKIGLQPAKWF